jgi:hypothetical protein
MDTGRGWQQSYLRRPRQGGLLLGQQHLRAARAGRPEPGAAVHQANPDPRRSLGPLPCAGRGRPGLMRTRRKRQRCRRALVLGTAHQGLRGAIATDLVGRPLAALSQRQRWRLACLCHREQRCGAGGPISLASSASVGPGRRRRSLSICLSERTARCIPRLRAVTPSTLTRVARSSRALTRVPRTPKMSYFLRQTWGGEFDCWDSGVTSSFRMVTLPERTEVPQ